MAGVVMPPRWPPGTWLPPSHFCVDGHEKVAWYDAMAWSTCWVCDKPAHRQLGKPVAIRDPSSGPRYDESG